MLKRLKQYHHNRKQGFSRKTAWILSQYVKIKECDICDNWVMYTIVAIMATWGLAIALIVLES